MNIYQELYKKIGFSSKRSEEAKKKCFVVWKDKRNQEFDAKRETLFYESKDFTSNEKENKRPKKNIVITWKNERRNKALPKKKPPFVVGIVRHKIYSPPFLHKKSVKPTEPKKKIPRQSFAPKNYKFKPPQGLKINVLKPISEKGGSSPFKNPFVKQNQIVANKKEHAFDNVTIRPRAKPLRGSTPNTITPKNTKTKKDVVIQEHEDVKKMLYTDDNNEPPIFGKLNLLKYKEKTAKTTEDCTVPRLDLQNQQGSNCTEDNSTEKECSFKPPTSYACSQQIQNLLEQKDLRFTELHSNSESNQIKKRISEMRSPNLSRISFTTSNTITENNIMTEIENRIKENKDNSEKNKSFEYNGISSANNELNVTIHADDADVVDEETLNYFNLNNTPNISVPENFNFKLMSSETTVNETKDSDTIQDSPLPEIVKSPVKRISEERIFTENEDNRKSKVFNKCNSFNLSPIFTEFKGDVERNEKKEPLNGNETLLQKVEDSLNDSKTLKNKNLLETENNESSKSSNANSSDEEITCINASNFIIAEENTTPKINVQNEQETSKYTEVVESKVETGKDVNIASLENIINDSMSKLRELSPRDHNNVLHLQSEIVVTTKTSLESDEKGIFEKSNLNESSNGFITCEKSVKSQSSQAVTKDLNINKVQKNEYENQTEIIELSDSPLKQENVNSEKNLVLSKLHDKLTENLQSSTQKSVVKKPLNIENKDVESALLRTLTFQEKFVYPNLKDIKTSMSDDNCNSSIVLPNSNKKLQNSQTGEIETVDLISDDEEEAESFLCKIKARYEINTSPKLNPERIALASIENIQVFRVSPCKTPRSPLFTRENSPTSSAVASPMRILSLRNRKVGVSPSPNKTKKTPRKALFTKNNLPDLNGQTPETNSAELNADRLPVSSLENDQESICKKSQSKVQTEENSPLLRNIPKVKFSPCKTPQPQLLVTQNSPISSAVESPMRILSLRNRKIGVSPSPNKTKKTPRKALFAKNNLPELNGQTPETNSAENTATSSRLEKVQNSTCNTPRLQGEAKENNIPNLHISPCEARPKLLVKENSPVTNSMSSPMRILCLRSRKVDVTPSPNKKTPKKTPRGKGTPIK